MERSALSVCLSVCLALSGMVLFTMPGCDRAAITTASLGIELPPGARVWYYTDTTGAVMELITDQPPTSFDTSLIACGWTPRTLDELHAAGLLAPAEAESLAKAKGTYNEVQLDGFSHISYLVLNIEVDQKTAIAGARSSRSWYMPGLLRAVSRLRVHEAAQGWRDSGWRWGWSVTVQTPVHRWSRNYPALPVKALGEHCYQQPVFWYYTVYQTMF